MRRDGRFVHADACPRYWLLVTQVCASRSVHRAHLVCRQTRASPREPRRYQLLASSICVPEIFLQLSASSSWETRRAYASRTTRLTTRGWETREKTRRSRGRWNREGPKGKTEREGERGRLKRQDATEHAKWSSTCIGMPRLPSPSVGKPAFSCFHGQITVGAITPISDHVLVPILRRRRDPPRSVHQYWISSSRDYTAVVALSPVTLDRICSVELGRRESPPRATNRTPSLSHVLAVAVNSNRDWTSLN